MSTSDTAPTDEPAIGESVPDSTDGTLQDFLLDDLQRCRNARLHLLVSAILVIGISGLVVAITAFSVAFNAELTVSGFITHLTVNGAWFFFSFFALVGLFAAFPAHPWSNREGRRKAIAGAELFGTLFSRWLIVGGAMVLAFVIPLVVAVAFFDSISFLTYLVFVILTATVICAYASIGVAFAAVSRSKTRLVFWLLAFYWLLAFLWETSLIPLVVAIGVTGDPAGTIGTPPTIHDALLAVSPGGAHAAISNVLTGGTFGTVELVGAVALLGWLVVPPLLALSLIGQ